MNPEQLWEELTQLQADGLACVTCEANYLQVAVEHRPVGRSVTGSQVFVCRSCITHKNGPTDGREGQR